MKTPKILLLSLAIAASLAACQKPAEPAATASAAAPAAPAPYTLDKSKLPPSPSFTLPALDPAKPPRLHSPPDDGDDRIPGLTQSWLLYTSPRPPDRTRYRLPSSA